MPGLYQLASPASLPAVPAPATGDQSRRSRLSVRPPTGGNLLLADLRVAFELINHARYQALERILGVPRDQANVATVVIALIASEAAHARYQSLVGGPPVPAAVDLAMGAAAARELFSRLTGLPPEDTPVLGAVLAFAAFVGVTRPALIRSARAARKLPPATRKVAHRMNTGFRRRYGYLLDPGNLRESRARRRAERR